MADYSFVDRLLHRVACGICPVAEFSFDIEQSRFGDKAPHSNGDHVFICGLARAGTTILMRRLYDTGAFSSLTYRDMPFVLAPNTWHQFAGHGRRDIKKKERAHKDGIEVDVDSPEALDEIFWRIFTGESYISPAGLRPIPIDTETVEKFRKYVGTILLRYGATRYLSKGNNNILRLETLIRAFPRAVILIPFRDPVSQAISLQRQHFNMLALNERDPFSASYMNWLAHHEFGLNQRPFLLTEATVTGDPQTLEYWLQRWCDTYQFVSDKLSISKSQLVPVCYEHLCSDPSVFERICSRVSVPFENIDTFDLVRNESSDSDALNPDLVAQANSIYQDLTNATRSRLGSGDE